MSDLLRMTGMFSGMDTESIVQSLVSAKSKKVTTLKQDQTKLGWKQKVWQDVNSKVYSFYSGSMSTMRLEGSYAKKKTKTSDATKASVIAGDNAVNGSQTLEVKSLAASGYLTGAKLSPKQVDGKDVAWTKDNKLTEIDSSLEGKKLTIKGSKDGEEKEIEISAGTTIGQLVKMFQDAGVNASFDEKNQRFFVSAKDSGADADFSITAEIEDTLTALGLNPNASYGDKNACTRIDGTDAEIVLNGATFTSESNTFTVNGLSITAINITDEPISITTETDYDGIYDMIKDMFAEYNDMIQDIHTRYNADSARKFNMLTDEEKEAMSDEEVEKWENTIKDSLLRRDKDLYTLMNTLTSTMSSYYEVDGKRMYLSDFGISTLNYFEAEENERKGYHIDGDPDDEKTASKTDKLKSAIAQNPEETISFFSQLCNAMYKNIDKIMERTDYRSIYKVYDDKQLQKDYDSYTSKIAEAEEKLNDYEDKWYDKFSQMEVTLSKLQSNQSAVTSMLG